MSWLPIGTPIDHRYVILGPIGYGGLSVVYQAVDPWEGRSVALKLLGPNVADDPGSRRKVHREAMIADRLRSPSVPRIYAVGDTRLPDGGTVPYVSMELLRGVVLAGRLAGGPLPWAEAVRVSATIADVLAIAHRRGVVHRDLTPDNIMMTASGAKIVDFGEATTLDGEAVGVCPPAAGPVDRGSPADDVYALGVLLYQMLTGRSPYCSAGPRADLAAARRWRVAPTPVLLVPGLPREVAEICRGCMSKQTEDRPGAAQVALALWAVVMPPSAPTPPLVAAAINLVEGSGTAGRTARSPGRRRTYRPDSWSAPVRLPAHRAPGTGEVAGR